MNKNTVVPDELLTKERLLDMVKTDASRLGGHLRLIRLICLGMVGVFCVIPIIVFCTSGFNWNNFLVFILSFFAFGTIGFLVYKMPKKLIGSGSDYVIRAIQNGNFRFLSDVVAEKKDYVLRDKRGHAMEHDYFVKCFYHTKGQPYRLMCEPWWNLVQRGDPVYLLEVMNDQGTYVHYEVFPSKQFMLDSELESYLDASLTANISG